MDHMKLIIIIMISADVYLSNDSKPNHNSEGQNRPNYRTVNNAKNTED